MLHNLVHLAVSDLKLALSPLFEFMPRLFASLGDWFLDMKYDWDPQKMHNNESCIKGYWVWMAVINSHTGVMVVCLIMDQPIKALIQRHTLQSIIHSLWHRSNNEAIFNPLFRRATMKQSNWVRALHCWRQNQGGIQMQQCQDLGQILLKIWATKGNADQNMGDKNWNIAQNMVNKSWNRQVAK